MNKHSNSVYASEALLQVPRLMSQLDRETHSKSYGSFDRDHWAWKFRDFPITMLQTGIYPLALLWRFPFAENPYYRNPNVLKWVEAVVESIIRRQHKNGAFDSVGPYTQDHGVTLAMIYTLTEALRLLGEELHAALRRDAKEAVRRACLFALRSSEDYAFISNHQALFAVAFLNASELLEESRYRQQADHIIEQILHQQSPDGWYREYEGPDPGYESLGLFYLATCWKRTGSPALLDSLRRSIDFYAHCVHPDGSVGGVYGSRHTSLYFPGGFEILAGEIPMAATVARFMRERLALHNVLTPAVSDAENLPSLLYTYLEASLASEAERDEESPRLPCEELDGIRHFPDSDIVVAGARDYYGVVNASKGGVCRIFNKETGEIAYEDAGYLVLAGGRRWASQLAGLGRREDESREGEVCCATTLAEVRQEMLTPAKLIVLRLLNLTLFRNPSLGRWLRRQVIARLITAKRPGPFRLERSIRFGRGEIRFRDRLEAAGTGKVEKVFLPRSFTSIHMGSAKYFHSTELTDVLQPPVDGMADELNHNRSSIIEFVLQFRAVSEQELPVGLIHVNEESVRKEARTKV
ncbi:MAG TPA: hypothetical protein VFQ92_16795 [Blastocatellia bacterium]|nr:hypothetical protein [Blastocatellia bacterium]